MLALTAFAVLMLALTAFAASADGSLALARRRSTHAAREAPATSGSRAQAEP
jgi:hypothetical protein